MEKYIICVNKQFNAQTVQRTNSTTHKQFNTQTVQRTNSATHKQFNAQTVQRTNSLTYKQFHYCSFRYCPFRYNAGSATARSITIRSATARSATVPVSFHCSFLFQKNYFFVFINNLFIELFNLAISYLKLQEPKLNFGTFLDKLNPNFQ